MKNVFESYLLEHFDATKEDVKEFELSVLALAISSVIVLDSILAVAEAVYKAIDNLEEDERKALYDDCDDLYDMILEKLGE